MTIGEMFPFFEGMVFEYEVDAAFEDMERGKAYLFKGKECAHIAYNSRVPNLKSTYAITKAFLNKPFLV
ncbi:hypothetical protein C3L33_00741, partial [Rhododendron williamsianum]